MFCCFLAIFLITCPMHRAHRRYLLHVPAVHRLRRAHHFFSCDRLIDRSCCENHVLKCEALIYPKHREPCRRRLFGKAIYHSRPCNQNRKTGLWVCLNCLAVPGLWVLTKKIEVEWIKKMLFSHLAWINDDTVLSHVNGLNISKFVNTLMRQLVTVSRVFSAAKRQTRIRFYKIVEKYSTVG